MSERRIRPVGVLRIDELFRALVDAAVAFVVVGGMALPVHGFVRGTKDLDIVPDPEPANIARLWNVLEAIEASPLDAGEFALDEYAVEWGPQALSAGGNWTLATALGRLDILQWAAGFEDYGALRAGAVTRDVPDIGVVWFAGRSDLIRMKQAAGRPQDLVDIERLGGA